MDRMFSFCKSNISRLTTEMLDSVALGLVRKDVALKVIGIVTGRDSVDEGFPVPEPWSEEAKNQASLYAWLNQYEGENKYQDGDTPIERILSKY